MSVTEDKLKGFMLHGMSGTLLMGYMLREKRIYPDGRLAGCVVFLLDLLPESVLLEVLSAYRLMEVRKEER